MNNDINPEDYRVDGLEPFVIADHPTRVESFYKDKSDYKKQMKDSRKKMNEFQEMMYAHDRYSILCIF